MKLHFLKKIDSQSHEIMRKGASVFFLKIFGTGLAFLFQIAIARYLGASGSGLYFLALTIVTLGSITARLGLDNSVTRFVSAHASNNEWHQVKGVVQKAIRITLAVSLVVSALMYLLAKPLAVDVFNKTELVSPLKIMSLLIVPIGLLWIYATALQGLNKLRNTVLIQNVLIPFFATLALYFLAPRYGISGAVFSYGIGVVISLIFSYWGWRQVQRAWLQPPSDFSYQTLLKASTPILAAILLQQLLQALPLLMLGVWGSTADVGLFTVAQRTAGLVSLVLLTANTTLSPKFAELYIQNDLVTLTRVVQQGQATVLIMAMPILLIFCIAPVWVLGFYGPDFSSGWLLLVIISLGQLVNVATGSVESLLIMTGNEKSFLKAGFFTTILSIVLCLGLIPLYGKTGAAIAFSISLAVVNLLRVYYVWHTLGIRIFPKFFITSNNSAT